MGMVVQMPLGRAPCTEQSPVQRAGAAGVRTGPLTWGRKAEKVEVFRWKSAPFGICREGTVTSGQCSVSELWWDQPPAAVPPPHSPQLSGSGSLLGEPEECPESTCCH